MKSTTKCTAITAIVAIVGLGVGGWAGVNLGYLTGASNVATISINTQVHDLENRLEALQALRHQDADSAIKAIEHGLDRDIVSLLPSHREELRIPEATLSLVEKGLQRAKRYRVDFPRASQGRPLDEDVKRALSAVD
jgi:D-arabinose 1-dehydrogenase-like Zn-dependent alcohol dehydrogenase